MPGVWYGCQHLVATLHINMFLHFPFPLSPRALLKRPINLPYYIYIYIHHSERAKKKNNTHGAESVFDNSLLVFFNIFAEHFFKIND